MPMVICPGWNRTPSRVPPDPGWLCERRDGGAPAIRDRQWAHHGSPTDVLGARYERVGFNEPHTERQLCVRRCCLLEQETDRRPPPLATTEPSIWVAAVGRIV